MDILLKIEEIDDSINKIITESDIEHQRCLLIYNNETDREEYKKLLYNGIIHYFSMLVLKELTNVLRSIMLREHAVKNQDLYGNMFFQPSYFEKCALFQLNSVFNKISVLIKYRFTKPDNNTGAEMSRILKLARKNKEFKEHAVNRLLSQIRSSNSYGLANKLREEGEHGLDSMYLGSADQYLEIDFQNVINYCFEIIKSIFDDLPRVSVQINNEDMFKYMVKEFIPPELEPISYGRFSHQYEEFRLRVKSLVNINMNYLDLLLPWLDSNEMVLSKNLASMMKLLYTLLNNVIFRTNDALRTYGYFLAIINRQFDGLPIGIKQLIEEFPYEYFMNMAVVQSYIVYDKIGLFLTRVFSMPKKKTYFKNVSEWIINNAEDKHIYLKNLLKDTLDSEHFAALDHIRQQYVHGFDYSVKQKEGTVLSEDYYIVAIFHNIENIISIVEYLLMEFFPKELSIGIIGRFAYLPSSFMRTIEMIKTQQNPSLQNVISRNDSI